MLSTATLLNVHEKTRSRWMVFPRWLGAPNSKAVRGVELMMESSAACHRVLPLRRFKSAWLRKRIKGRKRSTGGKPRKGMICEGSWQKRWNSSSIKRGETKRQKP